MNQKPSDRIRDIYESKKEEIVWNGWYEYGPDHERFKCGFDSILQFLDEKFGDEDENH